LNLASKYTISLTHPALQIDTKGKFDPVYFAMKVNEGIEGKAPTFSGCFTPRNRDLGMFPKPIWT